MWAGYRAPMDAIREEIVSAPNPERRERVLLTGDIDGIETDGSDLDQNLVLAHFGGRRFLKNDDISLKIWW